LPHVSLLRKNHIPLMGKNPLSLESKPIFARSRSHSLRAFAHNVATVPLAAASARINPVRLRTQALMRPGAHSPAMGSPAGAGAPRAATALAYPPGRISPPVHALCRACAPDECVPAGFGMGGIQHRGEPSWGASSARMTAPAGGFARDGATQDMQPSDAAWSLLAGSSLGAPDTVAFDHRIDCAIGRLHLGAFPRTKSSHKVAFTSGSGFKPVRSWPGSGLICAFLEGV